jgi:hypothetical protein
MTDQQSFVLVNDKVRANAIDAIRTAPPGWRVKVAPPLRSDDQNSKLHAILSDLAASPVTWAGKRRTLEEWKAIVISGHSVATGTGGEVIPGLEGEFVAIRESSARMGVARAASLITYLLAFCDTNGVELHETHKGGFYDQEKAA